MKKIAFKHLPDQIDQQSMKNSRDTHRTYARARTCMCVCERKAEKSAPCTHQL
ncbi:hypothetical protein [Bacteroides bouchesdurhonensis]|uniref:hypothetical protein n=1 Tax=Bacteroides bouchesdurhonensis TaxID=1841855 RepID=UPI0022E53393|nr:hypothetical protein [Bacteroides bouchesdurhonensis]